MFDSLITYLDNIIAIDSEAMWFEVIDRETQFEIIRLNTDEQLYNKGIDSNGESLGDYSEVSVEVYLKPEGHIRLYDEGDFYNSFTVSVNRSNIEIYADDVADYDEPLTNRFGLDILGLTEDSMNELVDMLKEKYITEIYGKLPN